MPKTYKPNKAALSHLKPKSGFDFDAPMNGNQGAVNLPCGGLKTGAGGNAMASMPSPKASPNKKLKMSMNNPHRRY